MESMPRVIRPCGSLCRRRCVSNRMADGTGPGAASGGGGRARRPLFTSCQPSTPGVVHTCGGDAGQQQTDQDAGAHQLTHCRDHADLTAAVTQIQQQAQRRAENTQQAIQQLTRAAGWTTEKVAVVPGHGQAETQHGRHRRDKRQYAHTVTSDSPHSVFRAAGTGWRGRYLAMATASNTPEISRVRSTSASSGAVPKVTSRWLWGAVRKFTRGRPRARAAITPSSALALASGRREVARVARVTASQASTKLQASTLARCSSSAGIRRLAQSRTRDATGNPKNTAV